MLRNVEYVAVWLGPHALLHCQVCGSLVLPEPEAKRDRHGEYHSYIRDRSRQEIFEALKRASCRCGHWPDCIHGRTEERHVPHWTTDHVVRAVAALIDGTGAAE